MVGKVIKNEVEIKLFTDFHGQNIFSCIAISLRLCHPLCVCWLRFSDLQQGEFFEITYAKIICIYIHPYLWI